MTEEYTDLKNAGRGSLFRKLSELRLDLFDYATTSSTAELLARSLETVSALTGSSACFFLFADPEQQTLALKSSYFTEELHASTEPAKNSSWHIDAAGSWGECVKLREPIIYNNISGAANNSFLDSGIQLERELIVPVKRDKMVAALLVTAGKPEEYTETDKEVALFIADVAWVIIEGKLSREALLEQYQNLFEQMLDGFAVHEMVYDHNGQPVDYRFLTVNPAFEKMTGLAAAEVIGKTIRQVVPAIEAHWLDTYAKVTATGQPTRFQQYSKIFQRYFDVSAFRPQAGLFACVFRDVTKEVELNEQLRHSQKLEAVGLLAGGIAHDFNNMLGVILGRADFLRMSLDADDPARVDLEEIVQAAEFSGKLTRGLLAFARKELISPTVLDLNETVSDTLTLLRRLIGENIQLSWQPESSVWPVFMDASQIEQILANLVVNARDAINDFGNIVIATEKSKVSEDDCRIYTYAKPGDYTVLSVSDDGCGMSKEIQQRLFEPFFTTKESGKGTGLGLSTVYGIIKQNNGFLSVFSEPGSGSLFKLFLPRHEAAAENLAAEVKENKSTGSETILLVEDENKLRDLLELMLHDLGYKVFSAPDAHKAIEFFNRKNEEVDLLLTDVIMPRMNGCRLLEELRKLNPNLKCLFMSGYTDDIIIREKILNNEAVFMRKPFSQAQLSAKIRDAIDGE